MGRKKLLLCVCLVLSLLVLPARASLRPVKVLLTGPHPTARILARDGTVLQDLALDHRAQAVAGPLTPGVYGVRSGDLAAQFMLRPNGSLSQVTGDGWTDGEILHLGTGNVGSLTIRYTGEWRWVLAGEGADEAVPDLSRDGADQCCTFEALPLGAYALEGPDGMLPILLTEQEPAQLVDLREKLPGPLG